MRAALVCCLFVAVPVLAQDKKPDKITAENIEVGKVGLINKLTVEKTFNPDSTDLDNHLIIANFDGLRVLIQGYSAKGIGKGKVLPSDQVWRVDCVMTVDRTGNGLVGAYCIKPEKDKKKEKK